VIYLNFNFIPPGTKSPAPPTFVKSRSVPDYCIIKFLSPFTKTIVGGRFPLTLSFFFLANLLLGKVIKIQGGPAGHFDQSSPEQSDHLSLLIDKKMWWSTKIGRGWSGTPIFPMICTSNQM